MDLVESDCGCLPTMSVVRNILLPRLTFDDLPGEWERFGHSDGWAWFGDGRYVARLGYIDARANDNYPDEIHGYLVELYGTAESVPKDETVLLSSEAIVADNRPRQVAEKSATGVLIGLMGQAAAIEQAWLEYGDE